MRSSPLLAVLLLTACPEPDGPPSSGTDTDGGASSSDGSTGTTGSDTTHFTHALGECEDGGDLDAVVCYTLSYHSGHMALRRLDMGPDSFEDVATTGALPESLGNTVHVDGDAAWVCHDDQLTRWDLASGTVEAGAVSCDSISRHADGFVVRDYREATLYPSLEHAFAGTEGEAVVMHADANVTATTTWGDLGIGSWHSTEELELFHWSNGAWNRTLALEAWDTWVKGLAATGGSVVLLDDGRADGTGGRLRMASHDLSTGELEWERLVDEGADSYKGLHCGCLDDAGVTWQDNDLDGDPGIEDGGTDCDDADPSIHPGADEACDGIDQDCDGEIDEDVCAAEWVSSAEFTRSLSHESITDLSNLRIVPDLDGDGVDDILAGEQYVEVDGVSSAGRIWMVPGPLDEHQELTEVGTLILEGEHSYSRLGDVLVSLGDIDGDGHVDFAVGARGTNDSAGEAYVFYGPPGEEETPGVAAALVVEGSDVDSSVGWGLQRIDGLLDGDPALLVSATYENRWATALHLFPLDSTGRVGADSASASLYASVEGTHPALDRVADLDGDGHNDLLLGVHGYDDDIGAIALCPGPITGDVDLSDLDMVAATETGRHFGAGVALLGDTDGDGYQDFAVNSAYSDEQFERIDVFMGPYTPDLTLADATGYLLGAQQASRFGEAMTGPGDVDGDGFEDLVVGEEYYEDAVGSEVGAVHLVIGPITGLATPEQTWVGATAGEDLGAAVQGMGDLSGDGLPDVLVEAIGAFEDRSGTWFLLGVDDL